MRRALSHTERGFGITTCTSFLCNLRTFLSLKSPIKYRLSIAQTLESPVEVRVTVSLRKQAAIRSANTGLHMAEKREGQIRPCKKNRHVNIIFIAFQVKFSAKGHHFCFFSVFFLRIGISVTLETQKTNFIVGVF